MKKLKLTGWYSRNQKPVRVGVYQRRYDGGVILYCWWDGVVFSFGATKNDFLFHQSSLELLGPSIAQNLPWRGVEK